MISVPLYMCAHARAHTHTHSHNLKVLNEKLEELREAIAHNPVDFWEYRIAHRCVLLRSSTYTQTPALFHLHTNFSAPPPTHQLLRSSTYTLHHLLHLHHTPHTVILLSHP